MPRTREYESVSLDKEGMFEHGGYRHKETTELRDIFYNRFKNQVGLLLESKRPKTFHTNKGRLNPRRAYRYKFSDNIFHQKQNINAADTTIVMLIDGSGSMDCHVDIFGKGVSRLQACNAVVSAFTKATDKVLGNEVKVEVFLKSNAGCKGKGITGTDNGAFVTLTRLFTNTQNRELNHDKLLDLQCTSPVAVDGNNQGSYTAEYSVLPALLKWMSKNITTKNVVVFNLTDGEAYASLGSKDFSFSDKENKQMRIKYLRNLNNATLSIGGRRSLDWMKDIYGTNVIDSDDDGFHTEMFQTFMRFIGEAI